MYPKLQIKSEQLQELKNLLLAVNMDSSRLKVGRVNYRTESAVLSIRDIHFGDYALVTLTAEQIANMIDEFDVLDGFEANLPVEYPEYEWLKNYQHEFDERDYEDLLSYILIILVKWTKKVIKAEYGNGLPLLRQLQIA